MKKYPSLAGGSHASRETQKDISSSIATAISIKSELYDAPRRSLRQKGLVPEQTGFPYYSPPRPRGTLDNNSSSADRAVGGREGAGDAKTTEGERPERETPGSQDVMITEVGSHPQRRSSGRSQRLRSRRSNTSESLETRRDESPLRERSKSNLSASTSSSTAADGGSVDASHSKEVRGLNNTHARRQIIRPWEDSGNSKGMPLQSPSFAQPHSSSVKKQPLHNGSLTSTTPLSTLAKCTNLESENYVSHRGKDTSSSATSNSVQEAAEALVEIGQLASSSSDSQVESMELETKKSTLKSVNSMSEDISTSITASSNPPPDVHPLVPKEVVIDRKRQLSLFNRVSEATSSASVEQMDRLHSTFEHIVFRHRMSLDKQQLIEVRLVFSVQDCIIIR